MSFSMQVGTFSCVRVRKISSVYENEFSLLYRGGKYTEEDAKAVMIQILNVVSFCHLQGVVHRDLKPEVGENSVSKCICWHLVMLQVVLIGFQIKRRIIGTQQYKVIDESTELTNLKCFKEKMSHQNSCCHFCITHVLAHALFYSTMFLTVACCWTRISCSRLRMKMHYWKL